MPPYKMCNILASSSYLFQFEFLIYHSQLSLFYFIAVECRCILNYYICGYLLGKLIFWSNITFVYKCNFYICIHSYGFRVRDSEVFIYLTFGFCLTGNQSFKYTAYLHTFFFFLRTQCLDTNRTNYIIIIVWYLIYII